MKSSVNLAAGSVGKEEEGKYNSSNCGGSLRSVWRDKKLP